MNARYRLPDEPLPSRLSRYAVDPMWPLLALMLAGNGLGLAWFAFNSHALGSPSRKREWIYIAANLIGSALLLLLLGAAASNAWLDETGLRYAALSLVAVKLACGYALYLSQQRSMELWEHFGGIPANGIPILMLLVLAGKAVLGAAPIHPFISTLLQ